MNQPIQNRFGSRSGPDTGDGAERIWSGPPRTPSVSGVPRAPQATITYVLSCGDSDTPMGLCDPEMGLDPGALWAAMPAVASRREARLDTGAAGPAGGWPGRLG
jgi:hypothetical protein